MRGETDAAKIRALMDRLGRAATGPGRVYFTGGATAVLVGWRRATVDANLKLEPEPAGVFRDLARLEDELDLNVELASPDDFLPPLPGWRERSAHIASVGPIDFFHYDYYGQALAKIERGHQRDLDDVREMLRRGLVAPARLRELFDEIRPELPRYPALDADVLARKLERFLADEAKEAEGG